MCLPKIIAAAAILAIAEARFGQEQIPVAAVQALGTAGFGAPGVADTLAGSIPGSLLAAANPCEKLTIADQIIDQLGTNQQVVDAAVGLVAAETNFNPFVVNKPFVCANESLPASTQLRGIVALVDPAVVGSDLENTNSETSRKTPFSADGLSQAEVMIAQGFTNFTATESNGDHVVLDGQDGSTNSTTTDSGSNNSTSSDSSSSSVSTPASNKKSGAQSPCRGRKSKAPSNSTTTATGGNDNATNGTVSDGSAGNNTQTNNLDFGKCQPTMARVGGLNGRPADEFTFIPQDPLVAKGQQEALNPNIITNRICDQLINVCEASDDAHNSCLDAKAQILALGTRDQSTADTWNALLGFPGVDSTKATL